MTTALEHRSRGVEYADGVCLAVLLGVILIRPLIAEAYDSAGSSMTRALEQIADPSPLTTLLLNAAIVAAGMVCFIVRARWAGASYRRTGLEVGTIVLLAASCVSCLFAGQKRLAINAALDWLCYPILAITLAQILQSEFLRRVALAVILAGACAQAVQCIEQATVGYEETWRQYEEMKVEFWLQQGVALDSPTVELFERRMKSRETQGFLPHSNVTGAYLVLCVLAGGGVAPAMWSRGAGSNKWRAALASGLVGMIAWAVVTTRSLGAILSGIAGVVLWILLASARRWIGAHRRAAQAIGWGLAIASILAFVGHGLYHNSFPHMSLTFRWHYWKNTAPMIADHFWTGVGRENFGRHYLAYKPIDVPEEISNPHNNLVQALAEWGIFGLLGFILLLIGAVSMLARAPQDVDQRDPPSRSFAAWAGVAAVVVALVGIRPLLLGADDPHYVYYATMMVVLPVAVGLVAFWPREAESLSADGSGGHRAIHLALCAGLFSLFMHDQISFALFVPGAATTCFALLGCALAGRDLPTATGRAYWGVRGLGLAAMLGAVMVLGVIPVARAGRYIAAMREATKGALAPPPLEAPYYLALDPVDPTPASSAAYYMSAHMPHANPVNSLITAREALGHAIERDPHQPSLRRMLARMNLALARETGEPMYFGAAIEAAIAAVALYPQDPDGLIFLAEVQSEASAGDPALRAAARRLYAEALELDSRRAWFETIRRWSPDRRAQIAARMEQLGE